MQKFPAIVLGVTLAVFGVVGCQGPSVSGDLDELSDANNNGFADVLPPDGVAFDEATNAKVRLVNTIGDDELDLLAEAQGIDPALLNLVSIDAEIVMTLDYDGFESLVIRQNQELKPFERTLEAACPDRIQTEVTVVAHIPLVGDQEVFSEVFDLVQGVDYERGETLEVETFVDENGTPQVAITAF